MPFHDASYCRARALHVALHGQDADHGLEYAASPGVHAAATPLRPTAPLDDLQQRPGTTPGSGTSSRGGASFGFRNSLGTLSERGEGHDAVFKEGTEDEEDVARVVKEEEGLDGGVGVPAAGAIWNAAAVAERYERGQGGEGNFSESFLFLFCIFHVFVVVERVWVVVVPMQ